MKQRNLGLDILRILLALMVIAIHFNAPATGHVALSVTGKMQLLVRPMVALCYPAVNIYVIISGYFSYNNKKDINGILKSLFSLWICLIFFQIFGFVCSLIINHDPFCISTFVKHLFPLSRGVWWYMTVYSVLLLISPALNMILDSLSKKSYLVLMALALFICSIIPFFLKFKSTIGLNEGSGLIWFMVLYLTGGGIKRFYLNDSIQRNKKKIVISFLSFCFLTLYLLVSFKIHAILGLTGYSSYMYNSIVVYGQAISLFVLFWNINIKNTSISKKISLIAGLSMAAYIFHCQEDIGPMLWTIIKPAKYANSIQLIPVFFAVVFGIFLTSILIEFLRKRLFMIGGFEKIIIDGFSLRVNQLFEGLNRFLK